MRIEYSHASYSMTVDDETAALVDIRAEYPTARLSEWSQGYMVVCAGTTAVAVLINEERYVPPKLTLSELLTELRGLSGCDFSHAPEAHRTADSMLLSYIGDKEITATFESIERWYE